MSRFELCLRGAAALLLLVALPAGAQSFRVQCPTSTITHPDPANAGVNNVLQPAYNGPTQYTQTATTYAVPTTGTVNGAIKCQQISGGDGYATMADGTQTFMFSFGPLSGLANIASGAADGHFSANAGTEPPSVFNVVYAGVGGNGTALPGDPATTDGAAGGATYAPGNGGSATPSFTYNGAIGLIPDADCVAGNAAALATVPPSPLPCPNLPANGLSGHVDPRQIMDVGVMNGNIPAPLMAFDEDDEFFLTLTNVGMIMRPDLFEQHTVHFHGYPNASAFYDGVPDASVAINIGGSFTYYYLAPDAGTYFWHCHITPPEHLQMGMVGQLYVRPRQDRVPSGGALYTYLGYQNGIGEPTATPVTDLRTACNPSVDILCSATMPATVNTAAQGTYPAGHPNVGHNYMYAYNDGDGSTQYDVEYPIQMHGFDPNFHFVGMTFNPEAFVDMKDKYFLLNGRSYPDTVSAGPQQTVSSDGRAHYSQPMNTIINIPAGGKALLRLVNLSVSEYHTLASIGIRMHVIGWNAKLLRDQQGHNTDYYANSITLGGGESLDVILDTCQNRVNFDNCTGTNATTGLAATPMPTGTYFLYTPNLDELSNDAENFGGMMSEIHVN